MQVAPSPLFITLGIFEILLYLAGFYLVWRLHFSTPAKAALALPRRLAPWNVSAAFFAQAAACVIVAAMVGQLLAVRGLRTWGPVASADPDSWLVYGGGSLQIGALLGIVLTGWIPKNLYADPVPLFEANPPIQPSKILPAGVLTFVTVLVVLPLALLWQWLLHLAHVNIAKQELLNIFNRPHSPLLIFTMVALAVVVAPITEELIFRAGLFRYLRGRVPRPVALVVPAIIFATIHANIAAFASLCLLGIIFSLAYERTGRISVTIIAHGLFNLHTIVLVLAGVDT